MKSKSLLSTTSLLSRWGRGRTNREPAWGVWVREAQEGGGSFLDGAEADDGFEQITATEVPWPDVGPGDSAEAGLELRISSSPAWPRQGGAQVRPGQAQQWGRLGWQQSLLLAILVSLSALLGILGKLLPFSEPQSGPSSGRRQALSACCRLEREDSKHPGNLIPFILFN